jgi:uncharacterized protein (TIGR03437 family)
MSHRIASIVLMFLCWPVPSAAQPVISSILNGASFESGVPRGCLVSIFGSRLAQSTVTAGAIPLPTTLAGTVVTVGDLELPAPLYFVSSGQINLQLPFEALGATLPIVVTTPEGRSKPMLLTLAPSGPGLFTKTSDGKGQALVFGEDFRPLDVVTAGRPMILYATGLGATDPPVFSGSAGANVEPLSRVVNLPDVMVGEFPARVDFAGMAPGLAGVYQLNVVPQQIGSDRLFLRSQGRLSNVTAVGVTAGGHNVTNAAGTIDVIYPTAADMPPLYSALLLAVKFTARMDILPNAGPVVIAEVTDAGTSLISVDPAAGSFDADVTVPAVPSRFGDFSGAEFRVIDLATCMQTPSGVTCQPFPGNIIPASRISPGERAAIDLIPMPNTPAAHSATALLKVHGTARPGSPFLIDAQNNASVSVFAGYLQLPVPPVLTGTPKPNAVTRLKLFIDGNLVASTDVLYRVLPF